jgi:glutathione synthase/RimK-type ligase-like ATP-grasp enzyme
VKSILVTERPNSFAGSWHGAEVVSAHEYLAGPRWAAERRLRVYNLCRTYGYQRTGWYVSLLAAARGHRPMPSVETIEDVRISPVVRIASEAFEDLIQRTLAPLQSERFDLSVYFGRNLARRYDRLCQALFDQFPAPLLRASFVREDQWRLLSVRIIAMSEVPESHHEFLTQRAREFLTAPTRRRARRSYRYDLALLTSETDEEAPSGPRALRAFARAAEQMGLDPTFVDRSDYGRIAEFDALFIRETTRVDHHTYRFARRAEAEGLVVIDYPRSIVQCANKVYQAELFARNGLDAPRTRAVDRTTDPAALVEALGLPIVLKVPDSAFSRGVSRVESLPALAESLAQMLRDSDLVVAQEWVPSAWDWRIGVLGREPLFACKYHMAPGYWKIARDTGNGRRRYGRVETFDLAAAPAKAVEAATRAGRLIGDGFYGVDVKELDGRFLLMEVNDNPNVDAGAEDAVLGQELYLAVMRHFRTRLDRRGPEPSR